MIRTFKDKEACAVFDGFTSKKYSNMQKIIKRKLDMLHYAFKEQDLMSPPANHFEHLKGGLAGFCSIRINNQFRLVFKFDNGNVFDVSIMDYHK